MTLVCTIFFLPLKLISKEKYVPIQLCLYEQSKHTYTIEYGYTTQQYIIALLTK